MAKNTLKYIGVAGDSVFHAIDAPIEDNDGRPHRALCGSAVKMRKTLWRRGMPKACRNCQRADIFSRKGD